MRWPSARIGKMSAEQDEIRKCLDDSFLDEWYRIIAPPGNPLSRTWGDDTEFPFLHYCLTAKDFDIRRTTFPDRTFGAIGDAISILSEDQFLWFLPHIVLVVLTQAPIERIACKSFIDEFTKVGRGTTWRVLRSRLSNRILDCLATACRFACREGWSDTRRQAARTESCLQVLGRSSLA